MYAVRASIRPIQQYHKTMNTSYLNLLNLGNQSYTNTEACFTQMNKFYAPSQCKSVAIYPLSDHCRYGNIQ